MSDGKTPKAITLSDEICHLQVFVFILISTIIQLSDMLKETIIKLPQCSGVYAIVNMKNWFVYVGSVGKQGIRARILSHLGQLKHKKHHSWKLQRAWNHSQPSDFKVFVLAECEVESARAIEQALLNYIKDHYWNYTYNVSLDVRICKLTTEDAKRKAETSRNPSIMFSHNTSGYRGVSRYKKTLWCAYINRYGKRYHIGYYSTPEEASQAYMSIAILNEDEFKQWVIRLRQARDNGKYRLRGEKAPWTKLTDNQVVEIRILYATKRYSQKELGKLFNVSPSVISNIVNRKRRFVS